MHTAGAVTGAGRAGAVVGEVDPAPLRPPLTKRLQPGHWVALDVVFAAALTALFLVGSTGPAFGVPAWAVVTLSLATTLPVAVRRLWPIPVLVVVVAASVAMLAIGDGKDPSAVVALAFYVVAVRYPWRTSAAVLAGVVPLMAAGWATGAPTLEHGGVVPSVLTSAALIIAAWVTGVAVKQQRAYSVGLREQAERRAQAQVAEARREVIRERLRIARELHDVVAHSLSLIAVQAGVGSYVAGAQPEEAARALASIEATSRGALRDMRRLVGVLREGDPAEPDLGPARGLADLDQLVTGTADAGVRVQLEVRGTSCSLPPGIDLAAYRIVQEALTNVVKHAKTTASRVVVAYSDDALSLEVTDDGIGAALAAANGSPGHGIAGMAERVSLYGGEFHASPLPGRGFRVVARLPFNSIPGDAADGAAR